MRDEQYRLLFYCQDSAGLGHVRRAVTLAAHLLDAFAPAEALILTRSTASSGLFALPAGCDLVKLPTLARVGRDEHGEMRTLAGSEDVRYQRLRATVIREVAREFEPHLLLVDNEPLGLQNELLPALMHLHNECPRARMVFGLRDIRGADAHVRRKWAAGGVYAALERFYHRFLVYGEREIYDIAAAYALPPAVGEKVTYCGYIVPSPASLPPDAVRAELGVPPDVPVIAVVAGSGADGYMVMRAYLEALPAIQAGARVHSVVVTGPLMGDDERGLLHEASSGGLPITVRTTYDTYALLRVARVVVCRGGYNSVAEALALAHYPLIIPRETRSGEQALRATLFQQCGWCAVLRENELDSERLASRVLDLLRRPLPAQPPAPFASGQALDRVETALRPLLLEHGDV